MAVQQSLYVKFSSAYRLQGGDAAQCAQFWLGHLGPERILWGSDWPWTNFERATTYERCIGDLVAWVPAVADRRRILWDTSKRLFRL